MTTKHSGITTTTEIHVPKGFTDASNNQGIIKNASGALEWVDTSLLGGAVGPSGSLQTITVTNIASPSELNSENLATNGNFLNAKQEVIGGDDIVTFYEYDSNNTTAETLPYIVATADGGNTRWVAISGAYSQKDPTFSSGAAFISASQTSKLAGVETLATADQTGAEIKAAYEAEADTNAFTDAIKTKADFISVTQAVDLDTMESDISTNTAKTGNVTHTGEVTGATTLTIGPTAISNKTSVTVAATDEILISDVSDSGNLKKVTAQSIADLATSASPTKEQFFLATISTSENVSYSIDLIGSSSSSAFTFFIPHDFTSIVSLDVIVSYTGSISSADIDLNSSYGAVGESIVQHQESDTTSVYTATVNNHFELDISGVFSSIAAGDFCGIKVTNNSITFAARYLGVRLRYT